MTSLDFGTVFAYSLCCCLTATDLLRSVHRKLVDYTCTVLVCVVYSVLCVAYCWCVCVCGHSDVQIVWYVCKIRVNRKCHAVRTWFIHENHACGWTRAGVCVCLLCVCTVCTHSGPFSVVGGGIGNGNGSKWFSETEHLWIMNTILSNTFACPLDYRECLWHLEHEFCLFYRSINICFNSYRISSRRLSIWMMMVMLFTLIRHQVIFQCCIFVLYWTQVRISY